MKTVSAPVASAEYTAARRELRSAERAQRAAAQRVAALRAALPPGPAIDPSTPLTTCGGKPVTVAGLLGPRRTLLAYHLALDEGAGADPADLRRVDGLDALVPHLRERSAVEVLSLAAPGRLAELARRRGWRWIAPVSTQPGALSDLLGVRGRDGALTPAVTSLVLGADGLLRVHWHGTASLAEPATADSGAPENDSRGLDPFCAAAAWLDLLPALG